MLVVLGGIFSGSCESYLEEVPQNKLKPNTTDDYDQLLNYGYLTEQVVPYLDILSDDVDLIASDHSMEGLPKQRRLTKPAPRLSMVGRPSSLVSCTA